MTDRAPLFMTGRQDIPAPSPTKRRRVVAAQGISTRRATPALCLRRAGMPASRPDQWISGSVDQWISEPAAERLSLPDGVFGRLPTGSTVTAAGRAPIADVTAVRTSAAILLAWASSPASRDSTARANDSRPLEVFQRTATALPARTP